MDASDRLDFKRNAALAFALDAIRSETFSVSMDFIPVVPRLASVQVGAVAQMPRPDGSTVRTAIVKWPVAGPVQLGPLGLEGDEQGNRKYHGGPDKAVCCFPLEHYALIEQLLGTPLAPAAFGENFTTSGLLESEVCVGDRFEVGTAEVEVSQPRQPCPTLALRWRSPQLPELMLSRGLTGWYLRVTRSGEVSADQPMNLIRRPNPDWPISRLNELRHGFNPTWEDLRSACNLASLSQTWREDFARRLASCAP